MSLAPIPGFGARLELDDLSIGADDDEISPLITQGQGGHRVDALTPLLTDHLLRGASQTALRAEIRRGSGLRSGDETTVVHAAHRRRVATDLARRGRQIQRWWWGRYRSNSLTGLSQSHALRSERGGTTKHYKQNAQSEQKLHGTHSSLFGLPYCTCTTARRLPSTARTLRQEARIIEKSWED